MENDLEKQFSLISYSQEGEDLILDRIFGSKKRGFYVDVGAHHPIRFSNTYLFYKYGWNGINIDATPGSMDIFKEVRPRDINLELAISDKLESLTFYMFNEPALNTFSRELASQYSKIEIYEIKDKVILTPRRIEEILEEYLPKDKHIDFLNVDVEGLDLQVLKSNNWERFRPCYVLVEVLQFTPELFFDSELHGFMIENNYSFFAKTLNTVFFKAN